MRAALSSVVCDDERRRVFGLHFCPLPFASCLLPSQLGCGGFEVARTNATAARACVAARGYEKTRKLNDARGARAGTDVATVGGRVSKKVLPRGDARCRRALRNRHRKTDHFPLKENQKNYEEACIRERARPVARLRRGLRLRAERQQHDDEHGRRRLFHGPSPPSPSPSSPPSSQKGAGRQHEHVIPVAASPPKLLRGAPLLF